ncbi:amino acid decarboxylase [Streptomyces djakartensis]|uniref:amino acid decarboxylase n=1 Tax=Streptomyces djakartensis TaxID=68193 RepID=UPI0034E043D0
MPEPPTSTCRSIERRPPVRLPEPATLELEQAMLPRAAFFALVEHAPAERAAGRISAETMSPCRPGVPAIRPARSSPTRWWTTCADGAEHGVLVPDAADRPCARCGSWHAGRFLTSEMLKMLLK